MYMELHLVSCYCYGMAEVLDHMIDIIPQPNTMVMVMGTLLNVLLILPLAAALLVQPCTVVSNVLLLNILLLVPRIQYVPDKVYHLVEWQKIPDQMDRTPGVLKSAELRLG